MPLINGLTDKSHPCQILADIMTLQEKFKSIDDLKICWIGDGNNVATHGFILVITLIMSLVFLVHQEIFLVKDNGK